MPVHDSTVALAELCATFRPLDAPFAGSDGLAVLNLLSWAAMACALLLALLQGPTRSTVIAMAVAICVVNFSRDAGAKREEMTFNRMCQEIARE